MRHPAGDEPDLEIAMPNQSTYRNPFELNRAWQRLARARPAAKAEAFLLARLLEQCLLLHGHELAAALISASLGSPASAKRQASVICPHRSLFLPLCSASACD